MGMLQQIDRCLYCLSVARFYLFVRNRPSRCEFLQKMFNIMILNKRLLSILITIDSVVFCELHPPFFEKAQLLCASGLQPDWLPAGHAESY